MVSVWWKILANSKIPGVSPRRITRAIVKSSLDEYPSHPTVESMMTTTANRTSSETTSRQPQIPAVDVGTS